MTSKRGAAGSASERVLFLERRGRQRMTCPSELRGQSFSCKFVSGKQCEGERRLDRLSSVFGHSRKVGFPDSRCVQVGREIGWSLSVVSQSQTFQHCLGVAFCWYGATSLAFRIRKKNSLERTPPGETPYSEKKMSSAEKCSPRMAPSGHPSAQSRGY